MKRKLLAKSIGTFLCLTMMCNFYSFAQEKTTTVSGVVRSNTGVPLSNVSVIAKNSVTNFSSGTQTDSNGVFKFNKLPVAGRYNFAFSLIGYEQQTLSNYILKDDATTSIIVKLKDSSTSLSTVVVIGYGSQQKKFVTGSVAKVTGNDLAHYSGSNFAQQLSGKAAGVVVNETSSQPGADPQVVIRGIGTLTAGKSPLIVVDGFPLTEGSSLNSINPTDIENIDILKDPASAAIYGSRAANGVILVTTRKGKSDKIKVSFDMYSGWQQRADKFKLADNAYDAALYYTEARNNGYTTLNSATNKITDDRATRIAHGAGLRQLNLNYIQPYLDKTPGLTNTNWLDEIFKTAPLSSYNLSLSGGTSKTNYYVSANYFDQEGIVINTGLKRYSSTMKLDSKMTDWLDFGISLNPSYNIQNYFVNNGGFGTDVISGAIIAMPFFPVYNPDGSLAISQQIKANTPEDGALAENPVAFARLNTNRQSTFRNFGNTYLTYKIFDGLKYKILLGGDYTNLYQNNYLPSYVGTYRAAAPKPATTSETNGFILNYLLENTLTYAKKSGRHDFNALAGYSFQKETGSTTILKGTGIPDDNIQTINGASAFTLDPASGKYRWVQVSYFGRIQYAYDQRYLASVTMRSDGSSRFGANNRWGNFPSVTTGWIVSNENFFPANKALTFAKLRATWGKSGNNQIGNYSSFALVTGGALPNYVFGNTLASGFAASTTPNRNLTWETRESSNFGVDLIFFNKLNLTAEYYTGTTKNLLLNVPVPEQSGFSTSLQNIGKVRNNGLEIDLSASDINWGKIKWGFSTNISFTNNKVLALAPGQIQIIQGNEGNIITKVGGPIAEFYGYNITGIYKSTAEVVADGTKVLPGTVMGDYKVQDINKDGVINTKDMIPLGTYFPKFTYGFNSNFSYKDLELSFSLVGVQGRKIYDRQLATINEVGEGFSMASQYYFDNRFDPNDNPNGFLAMPNSILSAGRSATKSSSYSIKDASYIRLRNVQLAYTINPTATKKIHINGARIYITANNLVTFTKYLGFNPDATSIDNNVLTSGQAYANYPVARSFVFGLNITL